MSGEIKRAGRYISYTQKRGMSDVWRCRKKRESKEKTKAILKRCSKLYELQSEGKTANDILNLLT